MKGNQANTILARREQQIAVPDDGSYYPTLDGSLWQIYNEHLPNSYSSEGCHYLRRGEFLVQCIDHFRSAQRSTGPQAAAVKGFYFQIGHVGPTSDGVSLNKASRSRIKLLHQSTSPPPPVIRPIVLEHARNNDKNKEFGIGEDPIM